ncbi:hypothetical protein E2542_SST27929 [Spatholobus suberectus]|nr:hypothetical protein E2542_SST27929 [Spatholobus suberectus]
MLYPSPFPTTQCPSSSFIYDFGAAFSRPWNSDSNSIASTPIIKFVQNYSPLDSIEPAKVIEVKDRSAFDATVMSEIDRTMKKKHKENMLHILAGVSARLTQLETRTQHLENSVDDLKVSVGNNHGSTDGKLRQLANILGEMYRLVPVSNGTPGYQVIRQQPYDCSIANMFI